MAGGFVLSLLSEVILINLAIDSGVTVTRVTLALVAAGGFVLAALADRVLRTSAASGPIEKAAPSRELHPAS